VQEAEKVGFDTFWFSEIFLEETPCKPQEGGCLSNIRYSLRFLGSFGERKRCIDSSQRVNSMSNRAKDKYTTKGNERIYIQEIIFNF